MTAQPRDAAEIVLDALLTQRLRDRGIPTTLVEDAELRDVVRPAAEAVVAGLAAEGYPVTAEALRDVKAEGWERDEEIEGGQPNGGGEIEPSAFREWFRPERETHHRTVITLTGPWEEGPSPSGLMAAALERGARERNQRESEDRTLREAEEIRARRAEEDR